MKISFTMEVSNPDKPRTIKVVADPPDNYLLVTDENDQLTACSDYEICQIFEEVMKRIAN